MSAGYLIEHFRLRTSWVSMVFISHSLCVGGLAEISIGSNARKDQVESAGIVAQVKQPAIEKAS
jgi:hypothetical protein